MAPTASAVGRGKCGPAPRAAVVRAVLPGLSGVSVVTGTRQAWAIGERFVSSSSESVGYLVHFSGLSWVKVVTFGAAIHVDGVSAVSGTSAWVWGYNQSGGTSETPFLARVSGGVVRQVRSAFLRDVFVGAMTSHGTADTWLAGGARDPRGRYLGAVVARWDGASWRQVPLPAAVSAVTGLSTSGPADTWAVARNRPRQSLLHWSGHAWSQSYVPPAGLLRPDSQPGQLLVASSARHAWVVYDEESSADPENGPGPAPRPVSAYLADGRWQPVRVPGPFPSLLGVTMAGPDAWVIAGGQRPAFLYSRLGSGWCAQPFPDPRHPACTGTPSVISAASPDYVIAVTTDLPARCRGSAFIWDRQAGPSGS